MSARLSLLVSILCAAGCTQNAILEMAIDLPSVDEGVVLHAQPQMRVASMNPHAEEWRGEDLEAIELGSERIVDEISLVAEEDEVDVAVKVRFCTTPSCTSLDDADAPERWYLLEHPFYLGRRTEWAVRIEEVPAARDTSPLVVGRCDIRGCVEGDLSSYCRVDGRHLCE